MSEASSERIEVERIGHVSRIWLNRPDKRNAQDMAMLDALDAALTAAERDAEVHAVILAGRGAHFSAGHDYKERQRGLNGYVMESHYAFEQRYYLDYCLHIWDLRKPIVAQVQGACVAVPDSASILYNVHCEVFARSHGDQKQLQAARSRGRRAARR